MSILKPKQFPIPIYQGDDSARMAELHVAVAVAERQAKMAKGAPRRGGDDDPREAVKLAQAAFDAFLDEAAERAVEVVVRSIGSRRFRELVAAHPPRTTKNDKGEDVVNDDDFPYGVNVETFAPALLLFAEAGEDGVRTIVAPAEAVKSPNALRDFLDDEVTEGDLEKIFNVAYAANRISGSDPKELRYSPSTSATSG